MTEPPQLEYLSRLNAKRIAVVSGSFRASMSYQENIWSERLAAQGAEVCVFCAEAGHSGALSPMGYRIQSIHWQGLARRHLYLETAVGRAVSEYEPDLILWFGPPQLFGKSLLKAPLDDVPLIAFMGQNQRMQAFDWNQKNLNLRAKTKANLYRFVRGPAIEKACRRADLVVANTLETPEIIRLYLEDARQLNEKVFCSPLGFDPRAFAYRPEERRIHRAKLGLSEDKIVMAVTSRFSPEKHAAIEHLLTAAMSALECDPGLALMVIGLGTDRFSQSIDDLCQRAPSADRIIRLPFADRQTLSTHFNAADVVLFAQPSISCQEALGTGAFLVCSDDGSMDWLLTGPNDGVLYPMGDTPALVKMLSELPVPIDVEQRTRARQERTIRSAWLSYDLIIDQVLARLRERNTRLFPA